VERGVEDEIAVNFVRAEDEVMAGAKFAEADKFFAAPDAGERVVRVAEVEKFGAGGDGSLERAPVDFPVAVAQHAGGLGGEARGVFRRGHERRINGGEREHFFAGLRESLSGDVEAADEAGEPDDPSGVNFPGVVALEGVDDGIDGGFHGASVTKNAVSDAVVEGGDDRGGGLEIHVGDPERQDVAAGVFLPFLGISAETVGDGVEVEVHVKGRGPQNHGLGGGARIFWSEVPLAGCGKIFARGQAEAISAIDRVILSAVVAKGAD